MSLLIDIDRVESVLLEDGWHDVLDGTFNLDSYEYVEGEQLILGGGQVQGVPSTGFAFDTELRGKRVRLRGPVTAILAVVERER